MGFCKEDFELIIPPKKQNKTIKIKSMNGYGAIREKLDEGNTLNEHASVMQRTPVVNERPQTKVSIGL